MKKIINGKKYDTETAKEIGVFSNGYGNDFRAYDETLYRKKTGEFFLYGVGGPMTKYAKPCGNAISGGTDIIPLSEAEAKKWIEQHMDADDYEKIFGEVEE